jgi:hypothetical protein
MADESEPSSAPAERSVFAYRSPEAVARFPRGCGQDVETVT